MLREWQKRIEPQKRLSLSEMAAESETTLDVEARKRALQVLPLYFKKIIGPYELRVYWFEVRVPLAMRAFIDTLSALALRT